jgi:hypothetical protein
MLLASRAIFAASSLPASLAWLDASAAITGTVRSRAASWRPSGLGGRSAGGGYCQVTQVELEQYAWRNWRAPTETRSSRVGEDQAGAIRTSLVVVEVVIVAVEWPLRDLTPREKCIAARPQGA